MARIGVPLEKETVMTLAPPLWSEEELRQNREIAEKQFIIERQGEGPGLYFDTWTRLEPEVRTAFDLTSNLRRIESASLLSHKRLWQILRYVCAPRVSEEDLWTLVRKKFKNLPAEFADITASTFTNLLDIRRFPWIAENRDPMPAELEAAILATTTLLAHETLGTSRRGKASRRQEDQVSLALLNAGLTLDDSRNPVVALDEIHRHSFSRERKVGGAKCDIPIRLKDGRLLALECKVSNGPKNSWKRLQREVGGKADTWKQVYGSQVITGAVLAGVFDLKCLVDAQGKQNVVLFWQHNLVPLIDFVT